MADALVLDASALVDLLLGDRRGGLVRKRVSRHELHAPAHIDAEVLSALGRLHRDGQLAGDDVSSRLQSLSSAAIERHTLDSLVTGAWHRRYNFRTTDALYVELALRLQVPLVTTDRRLANATGIAEFVTC